ncbi:hypothetical protein D3C87_1451930 [compost metagenome]
MIFVLGAIRIAGKITILHLLLAQNVGLVANAVVIKALAVKALAHDDRIFTRLGRPEDVGANV